MTVRSLASKSVLVGMLLGSFVLSGCATNQAPSQGDDEPSGPVINLRPEAPGEDLAAFDGEAATKAEFPGPPGPGEQTQPPQPTIPNVLAYEPPKLPPSAQEALRILKDTYRMPVKGYLSNKNVKNAYYSASFFRPSQTRNVIWTFYNRGGAGYSGLYSWGNGTPTIGIYAAGFHTCLHELCHHITLYGSNRKSRGIANQVRSAASGRRNCVPSDYSQTNSAEFKAEYFSFFAMKYFKFGQPYCYRSFCPPTNIKQLTRPIYVNKWGTSDR